MRAGYPRQRYQALDQGDLRTEQGIDRPEHPLQPVPALQGNPAAQGYVHPDGPDQIRAEAGKR